MSSTDPKMLKRKGADDVLADVDESKKAKSDPPTEESTENKSSDLTIGPDPSTEESTQNKPTKPTVETSKVEKPDSEDAPEYMQIIITGPPKCGKSCLVCSYMGQIFATQHGEFLSKQYLHILPENNRPVMIWDLDARNGFTEYRYQSYKEADIALLCFNVKIPNDLQVGSLENLLHPWIDELGRHCGEIPIILVGLKGDLRRNSKLKFFSEDEIEKVRKKYARILFYKEVSAYIDKNSVNELFATAIAAIAVPKPKIMFTGRNSR